LTSEKASLTGRATLVKRSLTGNDTKENVLG
jgi:hypothetical protein